jgi:hypothetical protein
MNEGCYLNFFLIFQHLLPEENSSSGGNPKTRAGGDSAGSSKNRPASGNEENLSSSSGHSGNRVNEGAGGSGSGSGKRAHSDDDDNEDPEKRKRKLSSKHGESDSDVESEEEIGSEEEEGDEEDEHDMENEEEVEPDGDGDESVVRSSNPSTAQGSPSRESDATSGGSNASHTEGNKDWLSYKELMETTYPAKSRKTYLTAFVTLERYLKSVGQFNRDSPPNQLSLLNYFHFLRTKKGWLPTTLWSHFSRINAVMKRSWGVNLTKYPRLTDLLKGYESGHRVKKASVFSPQQDSLTIVIYLIIFYF